MDLIDPLGISIQYFYIYQSYDFQMFQITFNLNQRKIPSFYFLSSSALCLFKSEFQMKTKYREAVANLAKQANQKKIKQIDPLSSICAQMRKTKHISKQMVMPSTYQSLFQKKKSADELKKQMKPKKKVLKPRENRALQKIQHALSSQWVRFLPQECDQFDFSPEGDSQKKNVVSAVALPKQTIEKSTNSVQQDEQKSKFNIQTFNIDQFKKKLGIGVKIEEPKVDLKEEKQAQNLKQEAGKPPILPFAGRPFQQAPPKPVPKKIHEYPPTCKVAGIYQWPPPKSEYRRWKAQMRESRKLG